MRPKALGRIAALLMCWWLAPSLGAAADAPAAPPRTVADITALLDQYRPDPRRMQEVRAILNGTPPQTEDRKDLARFFKQRAVMAEQVGAARQYAEDMRKVVEFGGEWDINDDLIQLALAEYLGGNYVGAIGAANRVITGIPAGSHPGKRRAAYGYLSQIYARLGDLASAQEAMDKDTTEFESGLRMRIAFKFIHIWTAGHECSRGQFLVAKGKLAEAQAALRKCIAEVPKVIEEAKRNRDSRQGTYFSDAFFDYFGNRALTFIALTMIEQGRLTEAELAAREALVNSIRGNGRYSFYTGSLLAPLVQVLTHQGRQAEAERLARAGLDIFQNVGTPDDSPWVHELRGALAGILVAQGRHQEALAEFEKIRATLATLAGGQSQVARGDVNWAMALLLTGQAAAAEEMLAALIPKRQQWLGEAHIDVAELVGVQAMALYARKDLAAALGRFRSALPVLIEGVIGQGDDPSALRTQRLKRILESYLGLLGDLRGTPAETAAGIDAANEAFLLADALRSQSTQGAVAASALRAAANDPAIGGEIRKEQDLAQEATALHRILRDLMAAPAEQQLPKVIADMQKRIGAIQQERGALQAGIERRFPAYANLLRPRPPSLAEARAALRPGEALLNIFTTDAGTYLWAFRRDGPVAFARVGLNRGDLARRVRTLRQALDPGDVDLTREIPDFDLDTAHRLYLDLLAPVAAGWQGAGHLLVASNGALSQLPLAVLTTAPATVKADPRKPYGHFRDVPWLVRQAAFTQLPSVNALVALRKLPPASPDRAPFVGFGDPQFAETPTQLAATRGRLRNLAIPRPARRDLEQAAANEWMEYGRIPPLPDTRDEILALARTLKADPDKDVFLGAAASKANVKKMDLSRRRVVAFATHGLLAGDFPGVREPALALANPGQGQHGLLTLEEILGLKLDADWVVLSACNTGAGDGEGADALSGLGRGFFYAGSRALLVTHWPVESASARLLVTGIFERQAADPKLSRAEALRQSMLALMARESDPADGFSYAHPLFWAPYALVGEGGG